MANSYKMAVSRRRKKKSGANMPTMNTVTSKLENWGGELRDLGAIHKKFEISYRGKAVQRIPVAPFASKG